MTEDTGKKISEELKNDFTMDKLWAVLCLMQGERFYTARGLEFHYKIRGNEIFVDRKVNSKSRYIIERRLFISLLSSLGVLFRMGKYRLLSNNEKIVLNVYLGK